MKNFKLIFLLLGLVSVLSSCSKEEEISQEDFSISVEDAVEISKNIQLFDLETRSDEYSIVSQELLNDENGESLILIINQLVGEDVYFSLISLDTRTLPVLGFGKGTFDLEALGKETLFWLEGQKDLIKHVKQNNIQKADFVNNIAKVTDSAIIGTTTKDPCKGFAEFGGTIVRGPIMSQTWGQGCVYNEQCPDLNCDIGVCESEEAFTGCVATAMAQIMGHHQSPSNYDWGQIQDFYGWNDFNDPGAVDIADLMNDVGESVNMNYGCDGSGVAINAYPIVVPNAFEGQFGFSSGGEYYSNSWSNYGWNEWVTIRHDIRNDRPVILSGCGDVGCHAWVCDGYRQEWGCEDGKPWSNLFLHMNWGWNGNSNGWFVSYGLFPDEAGRIIGIQP